MPDNSNSKDPLERLFEKKARDYNISFNEADWEKLEGRLNLLDKEIATRRKLVWIAAASLLMFSLLGYFTYQNYTGIKQLSRQLNNEAIPNEQLDISTKSDSSTEESTPVSGEGQNQNKGTAATLDSFRDAANTSANSGNSKIAGQSSNNGGYRQQKYKGNHSLAVSGMTPNELTVSALPCQRCPVSGAPLIDSHPGLTLLREQAKQGKDETPVFIADREFAGINNSHSNSSRPFSRFSFGLLAGPDLSTVGSVSDFYSPGYTFGLRAEFNLTSRLSIVTGIQQSRVYYTAGNSEYKPPAGFWTNGITADETIGNCLLLDIPLGFKYNVKQYSGSRFYATAGLSSYIMLHEDYRFQYYGRESELVEGWSGTTGTRHWLSNASFSMGYEFDIQKNWSLRAEPYLKIPISEVGWGNVNLYSLGSFISLSYKL